jgi:hypothetical protein
MTRKPERGELHRLLDEAQLAVGTWAPGDRQRRYRFFAQEASGTSAADYHQGHELYTALGRAEAIVFLRGYLAGRTGGVQ